MSDTPARMSGDGDLVARLRKRAEGSSGFGPTLSEEAADEIERLRGLIDEFDRYATHDPEYQGSPFQAQVREVLGDE